MTKRLLLIYPAMGEAITGGQAYDYRLLEAIRNSKKYTVDILTDDQLFTRRKALFNIAYLQKYFFVRKYDIILTNSRLYTRLALLFPLLRLTSKAKLIAVHHHFDHLNHRNKIYKLLEFSFLRTLSAVIVPSPYIRDCMKKLLPKKNILFAELSVEKPALKALRTKNNDIFSMLTVGTIEHRKGLTYLIEAMTLLKQKTGQEIHLAIVGQVTEEDYFVHLQAQITDLQLTNNISFLGRLSNNDLATAYQSADCFVFSSQLEGYGMVLLEALSYALPIVAFDNTAIPYVVKNNINGYLIENKNVAQFAERLAFLATNTTARQRLAAGAAECYKNIRSLDDLRDDFEKIIAHDFEKI